LEVRKQEDFAQVRNANPHSQRLLTVKEVAALLNFSQRWVHERTRLREIPCYRFGAALRFDEEEVWRWLSLYHANVGRQGDPI
jgi:excisionase family DNA binding protein